MALDGCKLAVNGEKKTMTSQIADMVSSSNFLALLCFFCQVFRQTGVVWRAMLKAQNAFSQGAGSFREGEVPENQQCFTVL